MGRVRTWDEVSSFSVTILLPLLMKLWPPMPLPMPPPGDMLGIMPGMPPGIMPGIMPFMPFMPFMPGIMPAHTPTMLSLRPQVRPQTCSREVLH